MAAALVLLCSCTSSEPRTQILKVYNWADYIDEDVLANFPKWYEQQTGEKVRVIYQTFDINEIMLTKIERGHEDYDVVCPSEYIIERMLRKDLLLPIDTAFGRTPNFIKNVSPYITRQIDATSSNGRVAHRYAVGYMWGTCGILYNKKHVPLADAQTWGTLWNRKYRGKLLMKDSYGNTFAQFPVEDYAEVHVIDLRFFKGDVVEYAKENSITDTLALYGTQNFVKNTSITESV